MIKLLLEGSRPKTLIASLSPVLIGTSIASRFHLLTFICTAFFALSIQIGTNFANDYFDFLKGVDTKNRKGPRRLTQSGLIPLKTMKWITFGIFCFALLCSLYLIYIGGATIAILALCAVAFGYLYTGGPYPLGYLGLGDLFVFVFFGPVATAGTTYLQTLTISHEAIVAGIAPGLLSVSILTINNLRDVDEDRLASTKTLPVRFGKAFGKGEYVFCIITALFRVAF
jgi:1,4-dihydroxy-2-naphthoate octaprenyltransferase